MCTDIWRSVGLAAGVAVLVLTSGCGGNAEADSGEADQSFSRVVNVETRTVGPRGFVEYIDLSGTVEANRDVMVSAEESGVVRELFVAKGRMVREGQPIAKIDDRILRSQVEEARARAALARETWERRRRLYEEDGIGSELAYLEAKYAAEQARANLRTLEERLARTTIEAPLGGVLEDRFVEVGTMVNPGAPVARVVDLTPVKITAGVPERYAGDVSPGTSASVSFGVLEDRVFESTISYVGSTVNPENRTFRVEFVLPNPGRAVKPEMVADVSVVRRTLEDVLVVPQEALVRVEDGYVVFVVAAEDGETVARARSVVLGPSQRNLVVVDEGLEPEDRVVVVGQQQVADGDRVRVVAER